ncbi:MAG: HEAT repeat domain-containing protein [Deltaproteobacteria bacterium]|nr:HEAT repeat domain-containing protein [Deltaproteobacteria bacterium]
MKNLHIANPVLGLLLVLASAGMASAQEPPTIFDPVHGEISPGTAAPSEAELMDVIRSGAPSRLMGLLEHGEMVECNACVPLLEAKLLESGNAGVRELAAWWLRRRPFAVGAIMNRMRLTLEGDADPTRRSRAAEALGELMDAHSLVPLRRAVEGDADGAADTSAMVRASAVLALGRLNHPAGNAVIAYAIEDTDVSVRRAALSVVLIVNFYREYDALVSALGDADPVVRRRAAQLVGEFRPCPPSRRC